MATEPVVNLPEYLDLARTRRSVRSFRTDDYPDERLETILTAANNALSGAGVKPWEFVVVREPSVKRTLADIYSTETRWKQHLDPTFPLAGNSREFIDSPATVCVVGDRRYKRQWPRAADGPVPYPEKLFHQSLANCILTLHLAGTTAGIGTTWPSTRSPTQHRLRNALDLPEWYHVGSAAPLGYPDLDAVPMAKPRAPLDEKLHAETFDAESLPTYDDLMERKETSREENFNPDEGGISRRDKWNTPVELDEFVELTATRQSAETYTDVPVSSETIREVLSAGRWAPSAANSQPWEFIVVREDGAREAVTDIIEGDARYKREVDPLFDPGDPVELVDVPTEAFEAAPIHLVVAGNRFMEKLWPQVPDRSREKLFRHSMAACITSITYAARAAGLGTSWVTPTDYGQQQFRERLGLFDIPAWFYVEGVTPIGYPDREPESEAVESVENKIHWNGFDRDRMTLTAAMDDPRE